MHKPFKIKYASELAGTFVMAGLILVIVAGFVAGHSQAWFEGSFELRIKFDAKTGSLGLREGNEVVVLSTLAGRVGKIMPTPDGHMETTLIIKNRFRQFVRTDSTAKVKKKFVAAGDAFVEISIGEGDIVADGAFIAMKKDEELMETAQKLLADVQAVVLPMVDDVREVLDHVNVIVSNVAAGKGVAGSLINDDEMSGDIKSVVHNSNAMLQESKETFRETTRLIRAAQKSWLFRRHVQDDKDVKAVVAPMHLSDNDFEDLKEYTHDNLATARMANKPAAIAIHACNLGYCLLAAGDYQDVQMLIGEADSEIKAAGMDRAYVALLNAALMRETGRVEEALTAMRSVIGGLKRSEFEMQAQCRIMEIELLCDAWQSEDAWSRISDAGYYTKKAGVPGLDAAHMHALARVTEMRGDNRTAAGYFDDESLLRHNAGQYRGMAAAMERAGWIYDRIEDYSGASDRYFRAGRTLFYGGQMERAKLLLNNAISAADKSGDKVIVAQANTMLEKMK